MADVNCSSCDKTIVNPPTEHGTFVSYAHEYVGNPVCQSCLDEYDRQTNPRITRFQRALYEFLDPSHRHVRTRGSDPYAGEEWSFELFGTKVELSSVISFRVSIGRREFHEGPGGFWGGKLWQRPLRYWKYQFFRIPDTVVQYFGTKLFVMFEDVRHADYVEDPYGSLAYYE